MKTPLLEVIEEFLNEVDPMEFNGHMSAGVVSWFLRNHTLGHCELEAMEVYHFKMQEFFNKLAIIKRDLERGRSN